MSKLLTFDCLANIRDLGGMPTAGGRRIRPGKLIRSGHLEKLSAADREQLSGLLSLVVDLRTEEERTRQPDQSLPGVENRHLPILNTLTGGITREEEADASVTSDLLLDPEAAKAYMCKTYRDLAGSAFTTSQYAAFVRLLLKEREKAVLWHCTAGKDRAGIAALIVEEILGVPREEIIADYLRTNEYLAKDVRYLIGFVKQQTGTESPLADESLQYLFGAEEEYLAAYYETIEGKYGNYGTFLRKGLGLREEEIAQLKAIYLTAGGA